jgi:hypothetical protein
VSAGDKRPRILAFVHDLPFYAQGIAIELTCRRVRESCCFDRTAARDTYISVTDARQESPFLAECSTLLIAAHDPLLLVSFPESCRSLVGWDQLLN